MNLVSLAPADSRSNPSAQPYTDSEDYFTEAADSACCSSTGLRRSRGYVVVDGRLYRILRRRNSRLGFGGEGRTRIGEWYTDRLNSNAPSPLSRAGILGGLRLVSLALNITSTARMMRPGLWRLPDQASPIVSVSILSQQVPKHLCFCLSR